MGGYHPAPIATADDGLDLSTGKGLHVQLTSVFHIPPGDRAILAPRDDGLPVRLEDDGWDALVVAPIFEGSYAMFASPLGTWIPFVLIFGATWATGVLVDRRAAGPDGDRSVDSKSDP